MVYPRIASTDLDALFCKIILTRRVRLTRGLITKAVPSPVQFSLRFLFWSLMLVRRFSPRQAGRPFPTPDRRASDVRDGKAAVGSP
jgi:hypothetical protein